MEMRGKCLTASEADEKQLKIGDSEIKDFDYHRPSWFMSQRFFVSLIGFFVFFNLGAHRTCMSATIVSMVNHSALSIRHTSDLPDANKSNIIEIDLPLERNVDHSTKVANQLVNITSKDVDISSSTDCDGEPMARNIKQMSGPFVWDRVTQSHILGAFYYGYVLSLFPSGFLTSKFGGKGIVTVGIFLNAASALLLPIAAHWGPPWVIVLRLFVGIANGIAYPAMMALLGRWSLPSERTQNTGFIFAGGTLGIIISLPASGFICSAFIDGWEYFYYILGSLATLSLPLWLCFVSDDPSSCSYVSERERELIRQHLDGQVVWTDQAVPWCKVFRSKAVWAILVAMATTDWGYNIYLAYIPTYMFEILHFDLKSNGLLSMLPFCGHWVMLVVSAAVIDLIIRKKLLTVSNARKLTHVVGAIGAAICLVILSFMDCSRAAGAISLLSLGVSLCACVYCGFPINIIDISPTHSGAILGLINSLSSITGFVSPIVVAKLTQQRTLGEWQRVFFLTGAIYCAGTLVYVIWGSADLQRWSSETLEIDKTVDAKENDTRLLSRQGSIFYQKVNTIIQDNRINLTDLELQSFNKSDRKTGSNTMATLLPENASCL